MSIFTFAAAAAQSRRQFLTRAIGTAAAGAASLFPAHPAPAALGDAIRTFRIDIPESVLADMRVRITATRWPENQTVADDSQGVPLATMQELARY
jgi:Epoxide hydrolase N terminus